MRPAMRPTRGQLVARVGLVARPGMADRWTLLLSYHTKPAAFYRPVWLQSVPKQGSLNCVELLAKERLEARPSIGSIRDRSADHRIQPQMSPGTMNRCSADAEQQNRTVGWAATSTPRALSLRSFRLEGGGGSGCRGVAGVGGVGAELGPGRIGERGRAGQEGVEFSVV